METLQLGHVRPAQLQGLWPWSYLAGVAASSMEMCPRDSQDSALQCLLDHGLEA